MRTIARFSGAKIVGINNNDYQIKVGTKYIVRDKLEKLCEFKQSDFMHLAVPDNTYDSAYEMEATCHAPDKRACFAEVLRVVKPGGLFAGFDWVTTEKYNENDPVQKKIINGIEVGNGLPPIPPKESVLKSLRDAGWEIVEALDLSNGYPWDSNQTPWYHGLDGSFSLKGFRMTWAGRMCTHVLVSVLETLHIAAQGSVKVSQLLNATANDLVTGGRTGIFTPCYFFLARKPNGGKK